jgi:5-methylcytosine-specific restriction protein A
LVWKEFAHDQARLAKVTAAIKATVQLAPEDQPSLGDEDDIAEADEGRILTRLHRSRERSRKLVEQRKAKALAQHGHLKCEVCEFDFEQRYGERGKGFIEAHHTKPIHTLAQGSKTKLEDLALVCSNCHRMIHAVRPWLTVDELRALLQKP